MIKGNVLVIDDKEKDGNLICNRLRKEFIPYRFFQFDEKHLIEFDESKKVSSVRAIFLDLQLVSETSPGTADYDAAATAIEKIVHENNGAWVLVTWSTWLGETGCSTDYAEELFNHLRINLEPELRPYSYKTIDKSEFTIDKDHGEAKDEGEVNNEQKGMLQNEVIGALKSAPSLSLLCDWEYNASKAAAHSLSELTQIVSDTEDADLVLGKVLYAISLAESGKHIEEDVLSRSLSAVLTNILKDKIDNYPSESIEFAELVKNSDEISQDMPKWTGLVNKALHLDTSSPQAHFEPGSIYDVTSSLDLIPEKIAENKISKYIRGKYLDFKEDEKGQKNIVADSCKMIAMDITPPCDFSQKKEEWHKMILGIRIPAEYAHFACVVKRERNEGTKQEVRDKNILRGDYLFKSPEFSGDDNFCFIFNSKLTFSIPSELIRSADLTKIGRIREQLLGDFRSWLIRQTSRPGITEVF